MRESIRLLKIHLHEKKLLVDYFLKKLDTNPSNLKVARDMVVANNQIDDIKHAISLLQSENTTGGSASDDTSGGYTRLGNGAQAVEDSPQHAGEVVKSTLGKRTDDGNLCEHEWFWIMTVGADDHEYCPHCDSERVVHQK